MKTLKKRRSEISDAANAIHTRMPFARAWAIALVVAVSISGYLSMPRNADAKSLAGPSVVVGGSSRPVDGINVPRLTDQLVLYSRTATQTVTPTNIYGAEVVITNGKVSVVNDRLVTGAGATVIPTGAVVLSGHGSSRQWLVDNARVGTTVVLPPGVTSPTSPSTTAAPTSAKSVSIGTQSRVIDGVNVARGANQLVLYTRTGSQVATPTNIYGAEVVIVGGRVASINDRLVTGGGPTPIPAGGSVLSGHDSARLWLIQNARVGVAVTIQAGVAPSPPPPLPRRRRRRRPDAWQRPRQEILASRRTCPQCG